MKLITILFCLSMLISAGMAAETKVPLDRLNWAESLPLNANITLDGGRIFNFQAENISDIRTYGAVCDGATNDTAAVQSAIDDMAEGDVLIVPNLDVYITNIVFDPPNRCQLWCFGEFWQDPSATGAAVQIGPTTSTYAEGYKIRGLRVNCATNSWTDNQTGIDIRNLMWSTIEIDLVHNFMNGIKMWGYNAACGFNDIHMRNIYTNKIGLNVSSHGTSGWTNQNQFYGGRFYWPVSIVNFTDACHIYIKKETGSTINSLSFYSPSLESINSSLISQSVLGRGAYVDGYNCNFNDVRQEKVGNFTLAATSRHCRILGSYGFWGNYEMEGISNNAWPTYNMVYSNYDTQTPGTTYTYDLALRNMSVATSVATIRKTIPIYEYNTSSKYKQFVGWIPIYTTKS